MFAAGNEFNGGGFMPSPEGQTAAGASQKKNYDQQSQSVRKVTIKQIYNSLEHATGDNLIIDGKEIANVSRCSTPFQISAKHFPFSNFGLSPCYFRLHSSHINLHFYRLLSSVR